MTTINNGLDIIATLFLRAIKMIIAPLVLATLVSGIARMGDSSAIGRVALRAMTCFVIASLVSLMIGFGAVELLRPGAGLHLQAVAANTGLDLPPLTVSGFLKNLVPTSLVEAMAHNDVLQIVVFAVLAGVSISKMGEPGKVLLRLTEAVSTLMLRITTYVMYLAPPAVFAAVAQALAKQGIGMVSTYADYVGGFYLALGILLLAMVGAGASVLGAARQIALLRAVREPALIALATTSSEAAYPTLLRNLEEFGVPNSIASFVLPLGYSFNLVGSMCYCVFAALFVAQAYDIVLPPSEILQLVILLFVMSKGIASVPRASLLVVAATLPYFKLPDAGVLLILAVDHFLDMGRTATNTVGNAIVAGIVAKWEGSAAEREPEAQSIAA
jgi:Na+/H+-dicarboxylate symporter